MNVGGVFDLQSQGPLDLLEALKNGVTVLRKRAPTFTDFGISGTHYGWIQAEDIPALIALLDSAEPCQPVVSSHSSYRGREFSTVGHEAAYLIEGFRRGSYPFQLHSLSWKQNENERREFDDWCARFMAAYRSRKHV